MKVKKGRKEKKLIAVSVSDEERRANLRNFKGTGGTQEICNTIAFYIRRAVRQGWKNTIYVPKSLLKMVRNNWDHLYYRRRIPRDLLAVA